MNKDIKSVEKRNIDKTLRQLADRGKGSNLVFAVLLLLYLATDVAVTFSAGSKLSLNIFGFHIPVYSFAGVLTSLSSICVIFMTVYCGKKGFFTSLALLLVQFPIVLNGIIVQRNMTSLPGLFGNVLAILTITILYLNNRKMDAYQEKLREQAVTDRLTGLPNRFACGELVDELISHGEKFVVVSIDVNNFKSINDTMGFDVGNEVLVQLASRWKKIADTGETGTLDFITRFSGDEFVLIIRHYKSLEQAAASIARYDELLSEKLVAADCDFYITASFGWAEYPSDTDNRNSVYSCASAAMAEVKRAASSNHILHYSEELADNGKTLELENTIRKALENDNVFFNLQPQFNMEHKLRGFETLARLRVENGNNISPAEFIPAAEKVGLIDKLDGAVFRKAAAFFGELLKKSGADLTLSINASVRHMMKNDFVDEIRSLLEVSGIPANKLEIEITESIMIDSVDKALRCIDELRAMGVKLAIDDFGTGYSSLSYLNNFPTDLLKIDKSFIDKMNSGDSARQYVAAIISIGHIMGFDVISEGVEDETQLETLRSIGCDYIQGYVWGKPLLPEAAEELVMNADNT